MTASAKKKKEKKKDFQKTQLKVGKTKSKPSNYTDTSFKARSIVVHSQSLSVQAPDAKSQFVRHVSMLKSHSDSQRADSLAFLSGALNDCVDPLATPESAAALIPKVQPLVLDTSPKVRQQLFKLLTCLPDEDVRAYTDSFLLYIHAAMTSLHTSIRASSMDVLDWLMDKIGDDVVSHAGSWVKTLSCFQTLLGWEASSTANQGWSTQSAPTKRFGTDKKVLRRPLDVLNRFLGTGLGSTQSPNKGSAASGPTFPLMCTQQHLLPMRPNAYAHLNLFDPSQGDDASMIEDAEDRRHVFKHRFRHAFMAGLENMLREGGELGRSAAHLKKTIVAPTREGPEDTGDPDCIQETSWTSTTSA